MKYINATYSIVLLFLSSWTVNAQDLNVTVYDSIMRLAIDNSQKEMQIESLLQQNQQASPKDLAFVYYEFSKWFWIRKPRNEKKAIFYANKERLLRAKHLELNLDFRKRNLYNLGYFYRNSTIPDYSNALECFKELIAISEENELRLGRAYRESGVIYNNLGDFQRAFDYFDMAERVFKKSDSHRDLLYTYMSVSATCSDLMDASYFTIFLENHLKIEALKEKSLPSLTDQMKLNINNGIMYGTVGRYDEANAHYTEALSIAKTNQDTIHIFKTLNDLGVLRKKQQQFQIAETLHKESLHFVKTPADESMVYDNLADLYQKKEDMEAALRFYQKALSTLLQLEEMPVEQLPSFESIELSPNKRLVLIFLIDKTNAWLHYYQKTSQKKYLIQAGITMSQVDKLIDLLYFESREVLSKLFWRRQGAELYVKAVQIYYELNEPEKAFYYMEKNKGLLLLENITNLKARQYGGIPSEIIDREFQMMNQLQDLEYQLVEERNPATRETLKSTIFQQKDQYQSFIDSLEISYPDYHSFKKKLSIISFEELVQNLHQEEVILEYILGKNDGYVLYISKSGSSFEKIRGVSQLNEEIQQLYQLLSKPLVSNKDQLEYEKLSEKVVAAILPFQDLPKKFKGKKLNIVLDRALQSIPFEALQLETETGKDYLIRHCEVFYNYSLSLQAQLNGFQSDVQQSVVEFAPIAFQNEYLPTLEHSVATESILDLQNRSFTREQATKEAFLEEYDKSSIVFVSTHGGVEKGQPWLGFYNEKLTLEELYFTPNHKDMVVLSACKTSVGEYQEGESVFNISRGFINSGAKSVVSTLWNINEKSSNSILDNFFEKLNSGESKSAALQQAKLAYIDQHKNTSLASPYYWSSIVLSGNEHPIIESNSLAYYLTSIVGFFGVFIFLYWRRNRRNQG